MVDTIYMNICYLKYRLRRKLIYILYNDTNAHLLSDGRHRGESTYASVSHLHIPTYPALKRLGHRAAKSSGRADVSLGASLTQNQMVETEANDMNLCMTYSIENTSDMEIMSVKIQEK